MAVPRASRRKNLPCQNQSIKPTESGQHRTLTVDKRDVVLEAMEKACVDKITQPDFTMSLKKGSAHLIVTDETVIPEWF